MNPADQIEAIVARAVATLRSVERRHRADQDVAAARWRDPAVDDEDETTQDPDEDSVDERNRPVLGPAEIAALSDAAGG
ncbi:hypothetical protein [uncultured Williamsia sp.]|uniref:hypothetical protein n=1 Tax=uncultured Williamsia sp. TaxID=259311 RepID=UPI0026057BBD|nr:hypothetical protein [uncultured Williamsia sp.]